MASGIGPVEADRGRKRAPAGGGGPGGRHRGTDPGGRGRGRVGTYYALAKDAGTALVVSIAPDGVVAETVNAWGDTVARAERMISRPARPAQVAAALRAAATRAQQDGGVITRLAVVSAADPVERGAGRMIQLPGAP
jgi:hypothetical protein